MVFLEHARSVKKETVIINDPFVFQCTVRLVDKPQDTAGNGTSCRGILYVMYSELRNESQGESRNRVARESLPDDFIEFVIKDTEKYRPKQKPSDPKAKKNKKEKPQEDIWSHLDYFELPESDSRLKQVKLSSN